MSAREARRLEVRGLVQGVGFRPFVWRLADRHALAGRVRNRSGVVEIFAEGRADQLDAFAAAIAAEAPPLARVDEVRSEPAATEDLVSFEVDESEDGPGGERLVSPDAATCPACLAELFDPGDRRYRYPFINCTDCGPRFTIIESLPYDRARTSMRGFPMCGACRREYEDPRDRRFHAEPVACTDCGPHLRVLDAGGRTVAGPEDAIAHAAGLLLSGGIVALKGLGGFHLACDATDAEAVAALRVRTRRPDKPFAIMVGDVAAVSTWFAPVPAEVEALTSWRAPIVLVRDRGLLPLGVAPGHRRQGAMLPSTPLHHLLVRAVRRPLVMTSGNASDEPISIAEADALARLAEIADAFLVHDRPIVARYDDPVVRVRAGDSGVTVLRRARSWAPQPFGLCEPTRPVLGTGAELQGAFCLASGRRAYLSQHLGDLQSVEAMQAYREAFARYVEILQVEPEVVAHDLHPDLLTTRFAEELGLPMVAVQHHHAHVAATMAEHGLEGEVLGLAFDGLGLGDDGTIWGGELLACTAGRYRRLGRLRRVPQPGGDAATRDPSRMALSHAVDAGVLGDALALLDVPRAEAEAVGAQIRSGLASPLTSSAGRLFDAIAALAGVCRTATYDGQPAILLEQAAGVEEALPAEPGIERAADGVLEIDSRPLVVDAVAALRAGGSPDGVAARFHASFAAAVAAATLRAAADSGLDRAALGGGVFQNERFTADVCRRLTDGGMRVFLPMEVPVGDGGIALGQVLVAQAKEMS